MASELVEVYFYWQRQRIEKFTSQVDPDDPDDLQGLLEDAVARDTHSKDRHISQYRIEVRRKRSGAHLITYVGRTR